MKPEKFVGLVVDEYIKAREPVVSNKNIKRGRSHSISSVLEDYFSLYLVKNSNQAINVLIDQAITVKGKTFYPDISIVSEGIVVCMFDLKTDMGWGRENLPTLQDHHIQTIDRIRGQTASFKSGTDKQKNMITFSTNVTYDIVILNTRNSGKNLLSQVKVANNNSKKAKVFVLCNSNKFHTNSYNISKKELTEKLDINNADFENILKRIDQ